MSRASVYYRRTNPEDGLQARLSSDRQEVLSWVEGGPLRLVGAALADLQGSGKAGALEVSLEPVLRESDQSIDWRDWWRKMVLPAIKDCAGKKEYFEVKGQTYALAPGVRVDKIPLGQLVVQSTQKSPKAESIPKPTWPRWFTSEQWPLAERDTLPGTKPPDKIIQNIGSCAPDVAERLTPRTVDCALEFVNRPGTKAESAQKWLELLLAGLSRYHELFRLDTSLDITLRGAKGLDRLVHTLLNDGNQHLLAASIKLAVSDPSRRKVLGWGVWHTYNYNSEGTREFLEFLAKLVSDSQDRLAVWNDILLAAFAPWSFAGRVTDLDRILFYLHREEREAILRGIILQAALGTVNEREVADFVSASRHAGKSNGPEKLNVTATAALALTEGREQNITVAADAYRLAVQRPGPDTANALIPAILNVSRDYTKEALRQLESQLERTKRDYEAKLSERQGIINELRSYIETKREESRLDIRRGMLEVIAETLEVLQIKSHSAEVSLRNAKSGLEIAIQAGGAEWFGVIGEVVEYDPRLHQGVDGAAKGILVTITARGALVPGKMTGDFILIKAKVSRQLEEK